jgi:hypothetical protein
MQLTEGVFIWNHNVPKENTKKDFFPQFHQLKKQKFAGFLRFYKKKKKLFFTKTLLVYHKRNILYSDILVLIFFIFC